MRLDARAFGRIAFALAIGAVGGYVGHLLDLPLAWMIGAMVFVTIASLSGAPVSFSPRLRAFMIAVLGVMLGSAFTPELLDSVGQWGLTLSALFVYAAAVGAASFIYFRTYLRYDRSTAYFAAMPGGLAEMTTFAQDTGGDDRIVALVHTVRVMLIVLTIPIWFRMLEGYDAARRTADDMGIMDVPLDEMALLAAIGYAGALAAKLLKIPGTYIIGPMLASALAHLFGWTTFRPPMELIVIAQIVTGTAIGCRFVGIAFPTIARTVVHAAGATAIMVVGTIVAALCLHAFVDVPTAALVLAFAPGGLAEMSLVALALATDAAFVSTHHVLRIFFVVVVSPLCYRLAWGRKT